MVLPRYAGKVAQVKGIEEADRILKEYADNILKLTAENFKELGQNIVMAASARTPIKTGRLVSSNKIISVDSKKLIVGNTAPYAHYVHDGTSRMPARPFFMAPIQFAKQEFPNLLIKDCKAFYEELLRKHHPR